MNYSYTQISQYLTCPRRYHHRYLDGWQEKDTRAAMLFGRCFEQAVAALFRHEDPAAVLFEQWAPPQLVCYSWMTGINEVAQVVFVRKRMVEVQYPRATITDQQRQEFETLVDDTVRRIESGLFLPHSGIRFPQNPCTTCPFLGLCLDQRDLVEAGLIRKPGVDLGLFDELGY
jgi:hypothetical protein